MSFGNNNNNNGNNGNDPRPQGKEDVFNKVKFSSVKLAQTKQGSPTVGLYLKRDQLEKMHALFSELLNSPAGADGCKIGCIVISGKDYDSGYCYVNPKEPKQDNRQGNNQNGNGQRQQNNQNNGGGYRKPNNGNFGNRDSAKGFLANKRLNDGEGEGQGN